MTDTIKFLTIIDVLSEYFLTAKISQMNGGVSRQLTKKTSAQERIINQLSKISSKPSMPSAPSNILLVSFV